MLYGNDALALGFLHDIKFPSLKICFIYFKEWRQEGTWRAGRQENRSVRHVVFWGKEMDFSSGDVKRLWALRLV